MTHWKRTILLLNLIVVLIAGCGSSDQDTSPDEPSARADTPVQGGAFVRALTSEPSQIDPQGTASSGLTLVLPYLFDTLVTHDLDNHVHPLLAESWQVSEDGTDITFQLKEGVTFHDGTPLNAEAVQFTFERFVEEGVRSPIYGSIRQIAGIEVVDELTVRFSFRAPSPSFWSIISMPYAGIISPESARQVEETGGGHLVGSGPFMLESWQVGQALTLKRNPDYAWGAPIMQNQAAPHLEKLVFKIVPDATTQLLALQTGDVDMIYVNQPNHLSQLKQDPAVQLQEALLSGLVYLGFNCQKPPFDEVLVRQALSHAVDKEEVLNLALGGIGEIAFAPLPPTVPGFDPGLSQYELGYDPQKAQNLLVEAGFQRQDDGSWERDGQALQGTLLTSTRPPNQTIATVLQSQLKAIGVPVEIQQLDSRAVMQATSEGQFDLLLWRYSWNDADALNIFLASDSIGSGNRVAYSNSQVDDLLERGAHELDDDARLELYFEAQKIILQEAPWQPLYNPIDVMAIRDQARDVEIGYMGRMLLNDAWIAEP